MSIICFANVRMTDTPNLFT